MLIMKLFNIRNILIYLVSEILIMYQPLKHFGEDSTKYTLLEIIFIITLKEKNLMPFIPDIPNLQFILANAILLTWSTITIKKKEN